MDPIEMTQEKNGALNEGVDQKTLTVRRLEKELVVTRASLQDKIDQLQKLNSELKAAEERTGHLASFPEVNPNPVLEVASSGRIRYFNSATQNILAGLGMDTNDIAIFLPADMNTILQDLDKKADTTIYRELKVSDRFFAATVHLVPQFDVARIYAFDITERRQADEALRLSEKRLQRAQEIAHLGSWELDLVNNKLSWSDEVYRIFGLTPQEFEPSYEAFLEWVHPDDRKAVDEAYSDSLAANRDYYEIEHRVMRWTSNEIRYVHEKCEHIRDEDGRIIRSIGMVHDITERKYFEEALLAAKQEWERTFDSVPDLIAILDSQYRVKRANRAMAEVLGVTPKECIGRHCFTCVHGASGPPESCPHTMTMADGKQHVAEVHEERFKGDFLVTTTPLFNEKGILTGSVHVARDITERKRAEDEVKKLNAELNKSVIQLRERTKELAASKLELEQLVSKLARSNHALEQFAYVASHDLQEPLRMVSGFMNLLNQRYQDQLDDKAQQYITYAVDGTQRMNQLINDLLMFSRVRGDTWEPVAIDMNDVFDQTMANLQVLVTETKARVTREKLPVVLGESSQLSQLFQNLLVNAIKFRRQDVSPEVHVKAQRLGATWLFSVRDNGIGIAPEHCERIFQIFQRLHNRQQYEGTGIGLAVCKRIVEFHGGRLRVESLPGKGSTFLFDLSAAEPEDREK